MNFVLIRRFLKYAIIAFFGFHVMILMLPILLPLLLLFWFVSLAAFVCGRLQLRRPTSKPSGMDIINGKENDISRPYINIAFRFTKRNSDVENVRRRFQQVVLDKRDERGRVVFAKFTRVFTKVCGYHVWTDAENFDLRNHINLFDPNIIINKYLDEERKLPNEGVEQEMRKDLAGIKWETILKLLLSETGINSMKRGLPKWEILILPETDNRYTTMFRVHHSITDGLHFVRLITECLADSPIEVKLPYRFLNGNIFRRMFENLCSFSLLPYCVYKLLSCTDKNPLHGAKLTGKKKFFISDNFSVIQLKDIKNIVKVTINDIIFTCVASAVEKHFEKRNASVKNITAILAVNLRQQNKSVELKNDYAPTKITLPTSNRGFLKNSSQNKKCDILIDKYTLHDLSKMPSLFRLQNVKYALNEAKDDPCLLSIIWMLITLPSLLPACISEYILSTKGMTIDISNIQGPQNSSLIMNEAVAKDVAFWLPDREPTGIGVSISSYNGFMRVGLIVDEALMNEDEGNNFLANFRQEILNLHSEAMMLKASTDKLESEISAFLPSDIP